MKGSIVYVDSYTGNSVLELIYRGSLPAVPWLVENATTIYGSVSSLVAGIPILLHYYKNFSAINGEFKLYNISKIKTSLQLSNVSFKMGAIGLSLTGTLVTGLIVGGIVAIGIGVA